MRPFSHARRRLIKAGPSTPAKPVCDEFLRFEEVAIRAGQQVVFKGTNWTWRAGEQWAILGPDGAGKALIVDALLGHAPVIHGQIRGPQTAAEPAEHAGHPFALVSPGVQRAVAIQESSFYQSRWHSGMEHHQRTVADFLSQPSVEERNPYEVGARQASRRDFTQHRRRVIASLGIELLLHRKLAHLSHGELRKTILAQALLRRPRLLILDDPYAGLDAGTRRKLREGIARLMRAGLPVLVVTCRAGEIPAGTTHLLLVENNEVVAQGPKPQMLLRWTRAVPGEAKRNARASALEGSKHAGSPALVSSKKTRSVRAPLIELHRVTIEGEGRTILRNVTWTLREGECWALLGPNGAGKTTLLNLIQGDHPQAYSRELRLFGASTDNTRALWEARQRMGWLSPELHQHYPEGCLVLAAVCSGFFNSIGLYQACTRRQRAKALRWLADLGLRQEANCAFGELGFGAQRLVLLARAAVKSPRVLLIDEGCQGLDAVQRLAFLGAVDRAVNHTGAALLFVTHRPDELPRCITHILSVAQGRIKSTRSR